MQAYCGMWQALQTKPKKVKQLQVAAAKTSRVQLGATSDVNLRNLMKLGCFGATNKPQKVPFHWGFCYNI